MFLQGYMRIHSLTAPAPVSAPPPTGTAQRKRAQRAGGGTEAETEAATTTLLLDNRLWHTHSGEAYTLSLQSQNVLNNTRANAKSDGASTVPTGFVAVASLGWEQQWGVSARGVLTVTRTTLTALHLHSHSDALSASGLKPNAKQQNAEQQQ